MTKAKWWQIFYHRHVWCTISYGDPWCTICGKVKNKG